MAKRQITKEEYIKLAESTFGGRLKLIREIVQELEGLTDYSSKKIAGFGGFSGAQLSNIEGDRVDSPSIKQIKALCQVYNISMDILWDDFYVGSPLLFSVGYGDGEHNPFKPQFDAVLFAVHPNRGLTNAEFKYLAEIESDSDQNETINHFIHGNLSLMGRGNRARILKTSTNPGERQKYFEQIRQELSSLTEDHVLITPHGLVIQIKQPLARQASQEKTLQMN